MSAPASNARLTLGLCGLAFVTMLSYAVATSAAQSLYLSAYGSAQLPRVWIGVGFASALATAWLGRLSQRYDVVRLFSLACTCSGASLVAVLLAHAWGVPGAAFALYLWKDVYIVVLVELFWTFANVVFGVGSASRTYGLFCAAGSLGSVVGNIGLGRAAWAVGTATTMWVILPLLFVLATGCRRLTRNVPIPEPRHVQRQALSRLGETLRNSTYLPWLMVLVASMQAMLTLFDYRFSAAVEAAGHTEEARTQALVQLYAVINGASFALQLATGPILRFLGMPLTLWFVPLTLGLALAWSTTVGSYAAAAGCMVVGKCLDYSLFRAAKEILYIPLDYAEKTQGKVIVDIFTNRAAKAAASLLLLALAFYNATPSATLGWCWLLLAFWLVASEVILTRYRRLTSSLAADAGG